MSTIDLFHSEEDKGWIARLASAPGISAFGVTPAMALREFAVVAGLCPEEFEAAAVTPESDVCLWKMESEDCRPACGAAHNLRYYSSLNYSWDCADGSDPDYDFRYCPFCGRRVEEEIDKEAGDD